MRRSDEELDRALVFVRGSRVAAAKLLDMEPRQVRNRISHCRWLKEKWGKPVGRPRIRLGFTIEPYEPSGLIERRQLNFLDREIVAMIRQLNRKQVIALLEPLYRDHRQRPKIAEPA